MIKNSILQTRNLPECEGIFCFYDEQSQLLYAGIAEDIKLEVEKILSAENSFSIRLKNADVKFTKPFGADLINLFAAIIRSEKPLYNISLAEQRLYPHLKITGEKFPRLLVTRKIESDEAEYFGAFLPETGVRFLLDFLNRTFRLRNCAIPIDGDFPLPCTQFYEKRCHAPCVESICDKGSYAEFVKLVKLFLQNRRENLEICLLEKIESAAEKLDFETATFWRDIRLNIQNVWKNKDLRLWLNDAVDTLKIEEKNGEIFLYLVTQRRRKVLGKRVFVFQKSASFSTASVLEQTLWQFYQFHAPGEIRVMKDFPNRKFLADVLTRRENRQIKINVVKPRDKKITAERAFGRTKYEFNLRQIKPPVDYRDLQSELKESFNLLRLPERIECFDVAHISGTHFVAAKVVWENGRFLIDENRYWRLDEKNELQMLEKGIEKSFEENDRPPDLVLIDGGKPQLNAATRALEKFGKRKFTLVAAVKPPRRHNEISHFISESGEIFQMNPESEAMQMLVRLRDEAHGFANRIHRISRDSTHFYESAEILPDLNDRERNDLLQKFGTIKNIKKAVQKDFVEMFGNEKGGKIFAVLTDFAAGKNSSLKPLIVPIKYNDPNGEAQDLQPLTCKRKSGF